MAMGMIRAEKNPINPVQIRRKYNYKRPLNR
jgi:hypothetical protein